MNYLSDECLDAYRSQYPKEDVFHGEPGDALYIEAKGKTYIQPEDETEETFLDRLQRSREQGENLFHTEWPEPSDEDDLVY